MRKLILLLIMVGMLTSCAHYQKRVSSAYDDANEPGMPLAWINWEDGQYLAERFVTHTITIRYYPDSGLQPAEGNVLTHQYVTVDNPKPKVRRDGWIVLGNLVQHYYLDLTMGDVIFTRLDKYSLTTGLTDYGARGNVKVVYCADDGENRISYWNDQSVFPLHNNKAIDMLEALKGAKGTSPVYLDYHDPKNKTGGYWVHRCLLSHSETFTAERLQRRSR